jgi:hypothetical protein
MVLALLWLHLHHLDEARAQNTTHDTQQMHHAQDNYAAEIPKAEQGGQETESGEES